MKVSHERDAKCADEQKPGGELPFAFRDAFGCSRSLATFYDGI
jgi:hypothetical protein